MTAHFKATKPANGGDMQLTNCLLMMKTMEFMENSAECGGTVYFTVVVEHVGVLNHLLVPHL